MTDTVGGEMASVRDKARRVMTACRLLHSVRFPVADQVDGAGVDQLQAFHHGQRRLDVW